MFRVSGSNGERVSNQAQTITVSRKGILPLTTSHQSHTGFHILLQCTMDPWSALQMKCHGCGWGVLAFCHCSYQTTHFLCSELGATRAGGVNKKIGQSWREGEVWVCVPVLIYIFMRIFWSVCVCVCVCVCVKSELRLKRRNPECMDQCTQVLTRYEAFEPCHSTLESPQTMSLMTGLRAPLAWIHWRHCSSRHAHKRSTMKRDIYVSLWHLRFAQK